MLSYSRNYEVDSMRIGAGIYMYGVVVKKSSRSLSHLLMSSCRYSELLLNVAKLFSYATRIWRPVVGDPHWNFTKPFGVDN